MSADKTNHRFPRCLLLYGWLGIFLLECQLDAPSMNFDDRSISDLSQAAMGGTTALICLRLSLGAIGLWLVSRRQPRARVNVRAAVPLCVYLGWTYASVLWSDDPKLTLRRLGVLACMLLFAAGCSLCMSGRNLTWFLAAVPLLNLIPGTLTELVHHTFLPFSGDFRFVGAAAHPNVQGAELSLSAICIGCLLMWRGEERKKLLASGGSCSYFFGLLTPERRRWPCSSRCR